MFTCRYCFSIEANEGGKCDVSPIKLHAPKAYHLSGEHEQQSHGGDGNVQSAPGKKEGGGSGTVNGVKATHEVTKRTWSHTKQEWYEPGTKVVISKMGKGGGAGRSQIMFDGGHIAVVFNRDLKGLG